MGLKDDARFETIPLPQIRPTPRIAPLERGAPASGGSAPESDNGMDIEEIKTLTDLMVDNDLSEIMIRDGEKRIFLRRGSTPNTHPIIHHAPPTMTAIPSSPPQAPAPVAISAPAAADPGLQPIASPMVGTFYAAANPESPAFVKIGDKVSPDTVVCIIEAMKVFNEIKAEKSGTIESIDVRNGAPVEFGQPMMMVRVA